MLHLPSLRHSHLVLPDDRLGPAFCMPVLNDGLRLPAVRCLLPVRLLYALRSGHRLLFLPTRGLLPLRAFFSARRRGSLLLRLLLLFAPIGGLLDTPAQGLKRIRISIGISALLWSRLRSLRLAWGGRCPTPFVGTILILPEIPQEKAEGEPQQNNYRY